MRPVALPSPLSVSLIVRPARLVFSVWPETVSAIAGPVKTSALTAPVKAKLVMVEKVAMRIKGGIMGIFPNNSFIRVFENMSYLAESKGFFVAQMSIDHRHE